jgi:hypothetical protein
VAFAPESMVTLVPAGTLLLIGGLFLVASVTAHPVGSGDKAIEIVRLIHVIAWLLSVFAAPVSVVYV